MKKNLCLIAAVLVLLLLAGCNMVPAEAGEPESPSPPSPAVSSVAADEPTAVEVGNDAGIPAYYAAYAEIVRNHQAQYGPECIQQIYSRPDMLNYLMGVCIVRLIDFDMDGTLELMLAWPESEESYHSYCYAIWTSPDGTTAEQVCENKILDGVQSYCPFIQLVRRTDGVFLGEDTGDPNAYESYVYRTVSVGNLNISLSLIYMPNFGEDEQYLVNGAPVDYDTYVKAESDFLEGAEVTQISFALADFEDSAPLVEAIRATQESLLLLGIEPNEIDPDIILPAPEQVNYSSYLELVDKYLLEYGQPQILPSSRWDGKDDMPALGGLCVVRMSDLDGDGTDELILAYALGTASSGSQMSYAFGIWTLQNGAAQELILLSIPGTAFEPDMRLYAGQPENYMGIAYDTNTGQVTSITQVEYYLSCYGYDGERLTRRWDTFEDIPEEIRNSVTEDIHFSAYSYRWAAGMDWDTDSQQVLAKTLDTINLLRSST